MLKDGLRSFKRRDSKMLHIPLYRVTHSHPIPLNPFLLPVSSHHTMPIRTCLHIHSTHPFYSILNLPSTQHSHKPTLSPAQPSHGSHPSIGTTTRQLGANAYLQPCIMHASKRVAVLVLPMAPVLTPSKATRSGIVQHTVYENRQTA